MEVTQAKSDSDIGQPNLCLISKFKQMKKLFLVSMFMIASTVLTSCSNDDVLSKKQNTSNSAANVQLTDGQNVLKPIPPIAN